MEKPSIKIDTERCKRDGLCAAVCPSRIFRWSHAQVAQVEHPELCCLCGHCLAVCPRDAILHSVLDASFVTPLDEHEQGPNDQLYNLVRSRRSVRAYQQREVPRDLLERVARSAGYAPTGAFGHAGWVRKVVVVSGRDALHRVTELTAAYMYRLRAVMDGFLVRTVAHFSDEARAGRMTIPDLTMRLEHWEAGRNVITYDAPAAIFVHTDYSTSTPNEDCDAALMNILLSSHALGLGACWNGWIAHAATNAHVRGCGELADFLGLPDTNRIVQAATVGLPLIRLHNLPQRETDVRWVEN